MNESEVLQLSGSLIAWAVILQTFLNWVRDWRGGSPELRLIRNQIDAQNEHFSSLVEAINDQTEAIREMEQKT